MPIPSHVTVTSAITVLIFLLLMLPPTDTSAARPPPGNVIIREEDPTPTSIIRFSTPSVTHISRAGTCNDNYCWMGTCIQAGTGIKRCQCSPGYVGYRCTEMMVFLSDYVEKHPETKKKMKVISKDREGPRRKQHGPNKAIHIVNQRFYLWSKHQMKKDYKTKKKSRKKNSRKDANKIVHSAFQSAFGYRPLPANNNTTSLAGGRGREMRRMGGSKVDVTKVSWKRTSDIEKTLYRNKRDISDYQRRKRRNLDLIYREMKALLKEDHDIGFLCISSCETVFSYTSQLCPGNKLAVELRIEEHGPHDLPVKRVRCCHAEVTESCRGRVVITV